MISLETGLVQGPDEGSVDTYAVRVDGGRLLIDASRFAAIAANERGRHSCFSARRGRHRHQVLTKTTCPYCGVGCGVLAAADGTIKGDPDHPANYGRLCSKGSALGDTIGLEGRLLAKMGGQDTTWDAALDAVADAFSAAVAEHGPINAFMCRQY